jgi:hypothetical protein
MKGRIVKSSLLERMLASFGLLLIVLLGWACDQQTLTPHPYRRRARRVLACLVIESVTAIGWAIDHLTLVRVSEDRRGFAVDPNMQEEARR